MMNDMENQIYRTQLTDDKKIEFYVCSTNEINPYRDIKELGICVLGKDYQLDGELDIKQLDSLIEFLKECREYIKEYNDGSKPIDNMLT